MSILDQIFAPEKTDSEISAPKKSPLEIPPPTSPHDCGSPLFWKSSAGFYRCLGCSPPAGRHLASEIFDVHRQAGYRPSEPWDGGSGGPANRNTGTGAGGDAGGAGVAEMPPPDFSIDSQILFFDARRNRWVGSVRELMGYGPWPSRKEKAEKEE